MFAGQIVLLPILSISVTLPPDGIKGGALDETIDYDVFTYHDLSSRTELGMGAKLSLDGETWEVAKVTPPVHEGRRAALYCKVAPARAPFPADWDPSRRSASADEG